MDDCRLAMDWNAVNSSMKENEMTTTFLRMRNFSFLSSEGLRAAAAEGADGGGCFLVSTL